MCAEKIEVDSQKIMNNEGKALASSPSCDSRISKQENSQKLTNQVPDLNVEKVTLPENIIEEQPNCDIKNFKDNINEDISMLVENLRKEDDVKDLENQQKKTVTENKDLISSLQALEVTDKPSRRMYCLTINQFVPEKRNARSLFPKDKAHVNIGKSVLSLNSGFNNEKETITVRESASAASESTVEAEENVGEGKNIEETADLMDINNKGKDNYSNHSEHLRHIKVKQVTPTRRRFLNAKSPRTPLFEFNRLIDSELISSSNRNILDSAPINDNSSEDEEENKEGATKSQPVRHKFYDLMDELSSLHQEISLIKLQLNASQQENANLELEIGQKEEVIIKTQAQALEEEQDYFNDIEHLKEELEEKKKIIEKNASRELELELTRTKARVVEVSSKLSSRWIDELNYKKIIQEYEKQIAAGVACFEKLRLEHETVKKHITNLEFSFADVHQKYQKNTAAVEGYRRGEENLRHNLAVLEKTMRHQEIKYESLQAYAKEQLQIYNKEFRRVRDLYEVENGKLNAIIKSREIKCAALEVCLEQKMEERKALSDLCSELLGKRF